MTKCHYHLAFVNFYRYCFATLKLVTLTSTLCAIRSPAMPSSDSSLPAPQVGLRKAADDRAVDLALRLLRGDDPRDVLRHAAARLRLVNRLVRRRGAAAHLERRGAEAADDELAVAVRRAVEQGRLIGVELVSADEETVRMRVIVRRHVLRLGERRADGVAAARLVRRIPIDRGGPVVHLDLAPLHREFRVVDLGPLGGLGRVDLALPAWRGDAAARDLAGRVLHRLRCGVKGGGADGAGERERGGMNETHTGLLRSRRWSVVVSHLSALVICHC